VPQFRVKMDLVPGMLTYMWLTPTQTGEFNVLCEEYCGLAHYAMRGNVVIEEQPDFENWLATQPTFAETVAHTKSDPQAGQALYAVCAACHGQQGEGNRQLNAPKLSGQDEWYLVHQLKLFKEGIRGTHEDDLYGRQMAPMVMTLPDDAAIRNVAAYIAALPDEPAPVTMSGDVSRGKRLYVTCGNCHGRDGEGIWSVNAPRIAGINDWYLATQLENFKQGIRGSHPDDGIGRQMALVSGMLRDERSIEDVIAYINTLNQGSKHAQQTGNIR